MKIALTDGRPSITIDVLLRTRLLIQASSGSGKSWLLRRIAEQLHGKVPVRVRPGRKGRGDPGGRPAHPWERAADACDGASWQRHEIRAADAAYASVLLVCLDSEERANRAKIRAEITPEFQRRQEARDTKDLLRELITESQVLPAVTAGRNEAEPDDARRGSGRFSNGPVAGG